MLPDIRSSIIETPRDTNSRLIKGEVIAVGPKVRAEISVGECVLFTQACRDIKEIRGESPDLLLIRDQDLAGIIPADVRVTDGASVPL
jgi:co-chaperonin GroES (HSP10)